MLVTPRCVSLLCYQGRCKDCFAEDWEVSNMMRSTGRALNVILRPTYHCWPPPRDMAKCAADNKITDGMEKHSLLEKGWQGYCQGKPCLIDLLEFGKGASEHMDKGSSQLHILGFSNGLWQGSTPKPFKKLSCHGHGEKVLLWIESRWKHRMQG